MLGLLWCLFQQFPLSQWVHIENTLCSHQFNYSSLLYFFSQVLLYAQLSKCRYLKILPCLLTIKKLYYLYLLLVNNTLLNALLLINNNIHIALTYYALSAAAGSSAFTASVSDSNFSSASFGLGSGNSSISSTSSFIS